MISNTEKCGLPQSESKCIVWYIGAIVICWLLFKLLRSLWRGLYACILADLLGATVQWKKLGKWAVVTGSTDGIGKAYAKALAKKGFDIVLISRTQEKLETVAKEIESAFSVRTKVIAVDITSDMTIYDTVEKELEDIEVGVLVNNVGMSYTYAEYLTKVPNAKKFIDDIVKANVISCTMMTLLVLKQMENRKKGAIINVSSLSALSPVPLLSVYSATKVYVSFFSKAINEEYKPKGITVQCVLPGFVSTKMSKLRPSFATCTPDAFVRWAIKTVGVEDQTCGYPIHKLQGYIQEVLCQYFPENLNLSINHRMMNNIRKRYYKKFGLVDDEKLGSAKLE